MNRFDKFEAVHKDSLEGIKNYLNDEDAQVKHLVNWLFNTEHNPYGIFCDVSDAALMGTSNGFYGLCASIHHSLVDDGDISFPVVDGQPKIAFVWQHEDDVEKYVVKPYDPVLAEFRRKVGLRTSPELKWLKDVYEFTEAFDAHELERGSKWAERANKLKTSKEVTNGN